MSRAQSTIGLKNGMSRSGTHEEKPTTPPGLSSRAISATWLAGSTKMMPMFDTTASNDPPGSPVSEASPVSQLTSTPDASAFCAASAISSGVMSTPVTRAPAALAASATLPVPQARSTTAVPRSGSLRATADTTSAAIAAM